MRRPQGIDDEVEDGGGSDLMEARQPPPQPHTGLPSEQMPVIPVPFHPLPSLPSATRVGAQPYSCS
jgi:hypothetical protein